MASIDYATLSSQLLRALRAGRSQTAMSRRLGYRSNVAHNWESGRSFPTAAQWLRACGRLGIDVPAALAAFHRQPPRWLQIHGDPGTPEAVAAFLDDLRGHTTVVALAEASGLSRFSIARWLKAETEPRLPDFLRLVEAASLRLLDFLAAFVDPSELPCVAADHARLQLARRGAYELPWSQAVLRVLELEAYRALPRHAPGFVAARLGIDAAQEQQCLQLLLDSQQARLGDDGKYEVIEARALDTRAEREAARRLRAFWAEVGLTRLREGRDGVFAYNLCGVSDRDLTRIRELQSAYYRELRAIVASSEPVDHVLLVNLQLVPLS